MYLYNVIQLNSLSLSLTLTKANISNSKLDQVLIKPLQRQDEQKLCVPARSTQVESVFSWMGFLLNKRRLRLSGEGVLMQLILEDNMEL